MLLSVTYSPGCAQNQDGSAGKVLGVVQLTKQEVNWLKDHETIRIGIDPDWPPMEFAGKNGRHKGISSEVVRIVSSRLGIQMSPQRRLTWTEVMQKARNREIDVLSCVSRTEDREQYLLFTKPYLNIPIVIVTRNDAEYIGGLSDLNNRTVAVIRDYQLYERLPRERPLLRLHIKNSVEEALAAVSRGETFAFAGNLATISYLIPKLGINNLKVAAPTPYSYKLSFAVRKDWPELVGVLDKALATITQEERTTISQRWISLDRFYGLDYSVVAKWAAGIILLMLLILIWNIQIRRREEALRRSEERLQKAFDESNRLLAEASKYVRALLPEPMNTNEVTTDWRFIPSAALGGDCFGYHWLDEDNFAIYLADVSGHGVSAALLAVTVVNVLRSRSMGAVDYNDPAAVLSALNKAFPMEEQNGMYFTIWYGVYRKSRNRIVYSSGGHPSPILLTNTRDESPHILQLSSPNIFIGGLPEIEFRSGHVDLNGPALLYVFSDGVYEIELEDGRIWTYQEFARFLGEIPPDSESVMDRLLENCVALRKGKSMEDDFSIIEISFPGRT